MAAKKIELKVVGDAVQTKDGEWYYSQQTLSVSESEAKKLLESGLVEKG
jgi:hypothetical protein